MSTSKEAADRPPTSWIEVPPQRPLLRHWSGAIVESQSWLDKLADPLQNWVRSLSSTPGSKRLKDMLHGTWFGHPVHPTVTDIPIGAWTSTMLLDSIWLASENPEPAYAADMTLLLGLAGASVSAVTGLTDWSETDATDRRVGLAHGLLNASATLLNLTSFGLRLVGKRRAGIAFSSVGYALTIFASYLGGELSFAKGIGVNHVAWDGGSDDFVEVMKVSDLPEGKLTRVDAAGIPAVLLKDGARIYALAATCSHLGGPLDEGTYQDGIVTCPWHGSQFCMGDGAVITGPAVYAQPTFAVRVRDNSIELRRQEHA